MTRTPGQPRKSEGVRVHSVGKASSYELGLIDDLRGNLSRVDYLMSLVRSEMERTCRYRADVPSIMDAVKHGEE